MSTLGDMLAMARQSAGGLQALLARSDPVFSRRIADASRVAGLSPTGFVRAAVADFSRFASEEDWATLVSTLRESGDPGTDCLFAMVDWRLTVRGCEAHSHLRDDEVRGPANERSIVE